MKTAVEWLEEQLDIRNKSDGMIWHFKKAKEMEKEQIMEAWFDGTTNWDSESSSEQYYKETFKSESYQQKMRDKVNNYRNNFKSE
jgi:hypothetical protein